MLFSKIAPIDLIIKHIRRGEEVSGVQKWSFCCTYLTLFLHNMMAGKLLLLLYLADKFLGVYLLYHFMFNIFLN